MARLLNHSFLSDGDDSRSLLRISVVPIKQAPPVFRIFHGIVYTVGMNEQ